MADLPLSMTMSIHTLAVCRLSAVLIATTSRWIGACLISRSWMVAQARFEQSRSPGNRGQRPEIIRQNLAPGAGTLGMIG